MQRDSYSAPAAHRQIVMQQPGIPTEAVMDPEARLAQLEYGMHDMHTRLVRTEESNSALSAKCQALNESLVKAHQVSGKLLGRNRSLT